MNPTTCKSCGLPIFHGPAGYAGPQCMCRWTSAAPRQPEVEGLEVVAYECLSGFHVSLSYEPFGDNPVPLWRAPDAQRAIAELREQNYALAAEAVAKSEEIERLREAQKNYFSVTIQHGAAVAEAQAERDTLRQQRDRLAGLLREAHSAGRSRRLTVDELYRIDAALAEVDK